MLLLFLFYEMQNVASKDRSASVAPVSQRRRIRRGSLLPLITVNVPCLCSQLAVAYRLTVFFGLLFLSFFDTAGVHIINIVICCVVKIVE